ncbi:MAG: hypothetical protein AAF242_15390, partial [Bacteroidota bacterium]
MSAIPFSEEVDITFRKSEDELFTYDLHLKPNADVEDLSIPIEAQDAYLDVLGNLVLEYEEGIVQHSKPVAYQVIDGKQFSVESAFTLKADAIGFELGDYKPDFEVVIDPSISYTEKDARFHDDLYAPKMASFLKGAKDRQQAEALLGTQLLANYQAMDFDFNGDPDGPEPIQIVDLRGVPGFAQTDSIVVCAVPDTLAFLLFSPTGEEINDVVVTFELGQGMQYAGAVGSHYADDNITEFDVSDLTRPQFTIEALRPRDIAVIYVLVEGNCDIDLSAGEVLVNLIADYQFPDAVNGGFQSCRDEFMPMAGFSSEFKIPVINVIQVNETGMAANDNTINVSDGTTVGCHDIIISQDGISAYVDSFEFLIQGFDDMNYTLESLEIDGNAVPNTYDSGTNTITANVGPSFFSDGRFDESESLTVQACYTVMICPSTNPTTFTYQAQYGCNDQICGTPSSQEGAILLEPAFGADASVASVSITQPGQICGDQLIYTFTVSSTNNDATAGLWRNLSLSLNSCASNIASEVDVEVNGMSLPSTAWSSSGGTLTIDFKGLTSDPDGAGGLDDVDGDLRFDDLPGDQEIMVNVILDIGCQGGNCGANDCSISQVQVNGLRDCGLSFSEAATFGAPIEFAYGVDTSTLFTNDTVEFDNRFYTENYSTPFDAFGTPANGVELSYDFQNTNIGLCTNGTVEYRVRIVSSKADDYKHIRYTAGSAEYNDVPVPVGDVSFVPE